MTISKLKLIKLLVGGLMAIIFCSHLPLLIADIDEQVDAGTRVCYIISSITN